jgi:hypothetical protein
MWEVGDARTSGAFTRRTTIDCASRMISIVQECRSRVCGLSMETILLGEAPKHLGGYAFDYSSWSTAQIAAVIDVDPFHLNKVFWVMNVFDDLMPTTGRGFDDFPMEAAVEELRTKSFKWQRIICVGTRVAGAMESALMLDEGAIPENRFETFNNTARKNGWQLAWIPHPSGLRRKEDFNGLVLPPATRKFLRRAAGLGR